jgi:hypothetical protein
LLPLLARSHAGFSIVASRLNFELLERAATFRAFQLLVAELSAPDSGGGGAASRAAGRGVQLAWAQRVFAEWVPALMGDGFAQAPGPAAAAAAAAGGSSSSSGFASAARLPLVEAAVLFPVGGALLAALRLKPPVLLAARAGSSSSSVAVDPPRMAQRLLGLRADAARELSRELAADSADALAGARRGALARAFTAGAASESEATQGSALVAPAPSGPPPEDVDGGWSH